MTSEMKKEGPPKKLGQLDSIRLRGFRSIKSLELEFGRLNVLIGPNGAGKSNLIGFFKFMNHLVRKDLQSFVAEQGRANAILHFGRRTTSSLDIELHFRPNSYYCTMKPDSEDRFFFQREWCEFHADDVGYLGGNKAYSLAKTGDIESGLPARFSNKPAGYVFKYLSDWKVYHFHDTGPAAAVKQSGPISNSLHLREDAGNLAAFLYTISKYSNDTYERIVATIQRVAPFFHNFVLEPDPGGARTIQLRWKHRGSDDAFDAHSLSDGTLRFMCLAALLLQPALPTMILLDEPELGLHPYALQLLAGLLRSASTNTQVILSTQSAMLANEMQWKDVIVVDREEERSVFRRLEEKQVTSWLDDYGVGDLWVKNLIGGTPE